MAKCSICGSYSGKYPLCIRHLKLKQEGLVIKEDGKWIEVKTKNNNCLICNSYTTNEYFCNTCNKEMIYMKI